MAFVVLSRAVLAGCAAPKRQYNSSICSPLCRKPFLQLARHNDQYVKHTHVQLGVNLCGNQQVPLLPHTNHCCAHIMTVQVLRTARSTHVQHLAIKYSTQHLQVQHSTSTLSCVGTAVTALGYDHTASAVHPTACIKAHCLGRLCW
jgi:hypothetical protein